ncbi:MAG TPA: acylneuraminate cytidylyltransferase [Candidatus Peribacteraceae bacterium]|nr:acylneuraminate cytidylyltransferase [Candidatus Peribacteraceae bacterium]
MPKPSSVIAIIPARGGSERVPGKNLLPLAGHPLLAHSILQAKRSKRISEVYVSTEDEKIAEVARHYGATVINRPVELADSKASSESAVLHVLDERIKQGLSDPEIVVFMQCTAPTRLPDDLDNAIAQLEREQADSLLTACRDLGLFWDTSSGQPKPINYDYKTRQMEQDRNHHFRENGSFFIFRTPVLREGGYRLGGNITLYKMHPYHSFDVNDPHDVPLVEWVLKRLQTPLFKQIDLVVFDFDGVLTDNKVVVSKGGKESVSASRSDSWGITRLREAGIPMIVLSTETHQVVAERCAKLKLECFQGFAVKKSFLEKYLKEKNIDPMHVAYVGNDLNDLECMRMVGTPIAVANAETEILDVAAWVTPRGGGEGAVRDVCEAILKQRGKL